MPRQKPKPLSFHIARFEKIKRPGLIMFMKRYYQQAHWLIHHGAMLNVYEAHPALLKLCKELYNEDNNYFAGDIKALISIHLPDVVPTIDEALEYA